MNRLSIIRPVLRERLSRPHRRCAYICDRGQYAGYRLEDVCEKDPGYIEFLINNFKHSFPPAFVRALKECGYEW